MSGRFWPKTISGCTFSQDEASSRPRYKNFEQESKQQQSCQFLRLIVPTAPCNAMWQEQLQKLCIRDLYILSQCYWVLQIFVFLLLYFVPKNLLPDNLSRSVSCKGKRRLKRGVRLMYDQSGQRITPYHICWKKYSCYFCQSDTFARQVLQFIQPTYIASSCVLSLNKE